MRVVILAGAGLSADAGVPTFRGGEGLYGSEAEARQRLSLQGYRTDPGPAHAILGQIARAAAGATPSRAHRAIARYQCLYPETVILTQNLDLLLERAGAERVVHLHGQLDQVRCEGCGKTGPATLPYGVRRCRECAGGLRPDVVLFGEPAPAYQTLNEVMLSQREEDVLVVVGTHGNVIPVERLAANLPGRKALNNLERSPFIDDSLFDLVSYGRAAEELAPLLNRIDTWRSPRRKAGTLRRVRAALKVGAG